MSWQTAFARQAQSDLDARDVLLCEASLPACHQLHYLQMACEKLAKAHLIAAGSDPLSLQASHAYIAKHIPKIATQLVGRQGSLPNQKWILRDIRKLAEQIEVLAPSVSRGGGVPSNTEYPWMLPDESTGAPADHRFGLTLLNQKAVATLLKILRVAIDELCTDPNR